MSDADKAKQDYIHVPMALLELLDYTIHKPNRPHAVTNKRAQVIAMLALTGCTIEGPSEGGHFIVLRPHDGELLVGAKIVYLFDIDKHFERLYGDAV